MTSRFVYEGIRSPHPKCAAKEVYSHMACSSDMIHVNMQCIIFCVFYGYSVPLDHLDGFYNDFLRFALTSDPIR